MGSPCWEKFGLPHNMAALRKPVSWWFRVLHSWLQWNPPGFKGVGIRPHPWVRSGMILEGPVEVETLLQPSREYTTGQKLSTQLLKPHWELTSFSVYRPATCSPTSRRASALCLLNATSGTWSSEMSSMESLWWTLVSSCGSVYPNQGLSLKTTWPSFQELGPLAEPSHTCIVLIVLYVKLLCNFEILFKYGENN